MSEQGNRPSSRILWLDLLKIIGIVLVVVGHFLPFCGLKKFIYSFHVPLFFVLSGFLAENRHAGVRRVRIGRLLMPYMIWSALSIVLASFVGADRVDLVNDMLPLNGFSCWNQPMWFLLVLFLVTVVTPSFHGVDFTGKAMRLRWAVGQFLPLTIYALVVGLLLLLGFGGKHHAVLAWRQVAWGCFFYMAGMLAARFDVIEWLSRRPGIFWTAFGLGVIAAFGNKQVSIYMGRVGRPPLFLISSLALTFSLMSIGRCYVRFLCPTWLSLLGRWTVFILATHYFALLPFREFVGGRSQVTWQNGLCASLALVVIYWILCGGFELLYNKLIVKIAAMNGGKAER